MRGGGRRRGRRSGSIQVGGTNSALPPPVSRTSHPAWCTKRWQTRHNITRLAIFVSPPCSHGRTWWTSHHDGGRPHRAQPPSRTATARRRPSGMVRVARPMSNGCPAPPNTTGITVASQASIRNDAGDSGAAEIQACGAGAALQIRQPDHHVQLRATPTARGQRGGVGVGEHPTAGVGQRLGLALGGGAVILGRARCGLGVDERGDRVEHRRIVEPTHQPATAAAVALQVQLVHPRLGPIVGLGPVGVQHLQQLLAAGLQFGGCAVGDPRGQLRLRARPPRRIQPPRRVRPEDPGHDLDVAQARRTRREHGRGDGQPRRQPGAVQPDPGPDVLGHAQVPPGLATVPPEQIGQRRNAGAIAAPGERAATLQIGERGHAGLVEAATHTFADGQHPEQIGLARPRTRGRPQRLHRLSEQAARGFQRALRHPSSVSEHKFEIWPLRWSPETQYGPHCGEERRARSAIGTPARSSSLQSSLTS